jgi:hypothetical protein
MEDERVEVSISRREVPQLEILPPWSEALGKEHALDFSLVFHLMVELQESARRKLVHRSSGAQGEGVRGSPLGCGYPSSGRSDGVLDPPAGMEAGGGGEERWRRRVWRWQTGLHTRRVPSIIKHPQA